MRVRSRNDQTFQAESAVFIARVIYQAERTRKDSIDLDLLIRIKCTVVANKLADDDNIAQYCGGVEKVLLTQVLQEARDVSLVE